MVGKGIIAFSLLTDSKALGLVGNFSEILTDDCRYSWPLYIPKSTRTLSITFRIKCQWFFFSKKVHFDLIKLDEFQLFIHVLHSSFQRLMSEALKFDPKVIQQKQGRKVMYTLQCSHWIIFGKNWKTPLAGKLKEIIVLLGN